MPNSLQPIPAGRPTALRLPPSLGRSPFGAASLPARLPNQAARPAACRGVRPPRCRPVLPARCRLQASHCTACALHSSLCWPVTSHHHPPPPPLRVPLGPLGDAAQPAHPRCHPSFLLAPSLEPTLRANLTLPCSFRPSHDSPTSTTPVPLCSAMPHCFHSAKMPHKTASAFHTVLCAPFACFNDPPSSLVPGLLSLILWPLFPDNCLCVMLLSLCSLCAPPYSHFACI